MLDSDLGGTESVDGDSSFADEMVNHKVPVIAAITNRERSLSLNMLLLSIEDSRVN
ncbi:MAG: hypothetical protein WCH39_03370 [Schlesneria sp.]